MKSTEETCVITYEHVYITPDGRLFVHTAYRGVRKPETPKTQTITFDNSQKDFFLRDCEFLGEL